MPKINFPHGLEKPSSKNDYTARIISDNLSTELQYQFPDDKADIAYSIVDVIEKRLAKGIWENWGAIPNHYTVRMARVKDIDHKILITLQ